MIAKAIVGALKSGDTSKYHDELQRYNMQPRQVLDATSFKQNLLFAATFIKD